MRHHNIRNGLWHAERRNRLETTRYDRTLETSVGLYAQNGTRWTPWFRSVAGMRGDVFHFDVHNGTGGSCGTESDFLASPKLSLMFGPWKNTELYLNGGFGFHSNDARGVTDRTASADPLVRTKGAEIGVRTTIGPGLQSSLTAWVLAIDSELLFVGDAGTTEASRPSRRWGVEWANFYEPTPWLTLDADVAWSQARFRDDAPEGRHIPGSIETVVSAGVSVHDLPGGLAIHLTPARGARGGFRRPPCPPSRAAQRASHGVRQVLIGGRANKQKPPAQACCAGDRETLMFASFVVRITSRP